MLLERGFGEESEAGIRGQQWHEEVIKNAIVKKKTVGTNWHISKLIIHPDRTLIWSV